MENKFDVIIVGSGIAGLMCALETGKNKNILLVTKARLKDTNTYYAQGGIAAVTNKKDSFKLHIQDTLKAGHNKNNKKAVNFIISNAPKVIKKLESYGIDFDKKVVNKKQTKVYDLHLEGGHSVPRVLHIKDYTGKAIEEHLIKKIRQSKNVKIIEHLRATDFIIKNKICLGIKTKFENKLPARNRNKKQNDEPIFYANKVVLAAGGVGQLFKKTTNPFVATGDGIGMAKKANLKLKDLKYVQFHPTALNVKASPLPLITEAIRGSGAKLINEKNERFMYHKHPLNELAPRDIVVAHMKKQEKLGHEIFLKLDVKKIPQLRKEFPLVFKILKKYKINLKKGLIPVTAAAHYSCGGIATNLKGETSLKNLYACGEVAHTGLHGSNRLASNSLLEAAVMAIQVAKQL